MRAVFKFSGYISIKWILFLVYQIFESEGKSNWHLEKVNSIESWVYTLGMLLIFPTLEIIILSGIFYFALMQKGWVVILILILAFILEFTIGWFITNQKFASWMVIKLALSLGLFTLFYRKQLRF